MSDNEGIFKTPPPGAQYMEPVKEKTPQELEEERLKQENDLLQLQIELPHLYGWKWYPWAREFVETKNKMSFLCAANQISKSSTQIRKAIIWATDQALWPELWAKKPVQFWYLYPTKDQVSIEFETKWKQFLPRGTMKDDPVYGWEVERNNGHIRAIHFKSGVHIYFKTYAQNADALQTGTCDAIFCDEELPIDLFDELVFRISASDGYFNMVFTATLGQDFWRRTMEPEEDEKEEHPNAYKKTVSLYDALFYEDGTPSHWTLEKIKVIEGRCSTTNEILKRVHGKFIVLGGRKYESFDLKRHMKKPHPIPANWLIYGGADIGSGGDGSMEKEDGHKSALCYVAVSPDYRKGRVFLGWRGDNVVTTAGDVVQKHMAIVKDNKLTITQAYYDWGNADFGEIAKRMGVPFERAEKSHKIGEEVINTLFKNDMLYIYETEETIKLGSELASLKRSTSKKKAIDDFCDAFRYCVTKIPWDWGVLAGLSPDFEEEKPEEPLTAMQREIKERRQAFEENNAREEQRVQDEFDEWNEYYGG